MIPITTDEVCVIDDDPSVLRSLAHLLDSDGFAARTFDTVEEFLVHAGRQAVTLAVLDVWMPRMSGLELQEQLRAFSPNTRVIIITARDEPAIRDAAMDGGAFAFLIKPFDDEKFLALVRSVMRPTADLC
jgi:two-component system response regulator FixJ